MVVVMDGRIDGGALSHKAVTLIRRLQGVKLPAIGPEQRRVAEQPAATSSRLGGLADAARILGGASVRPVDL